MDFGVTDDCDYDYTSVHFEGKLTLLTDSAEKRHALEILVNQISNRPEEKLAKVKPEKLEKTAFGRIDISYMSGKKHLTQPKA